MWSPIKALVWEIWARNRWAFIGVVGLTLIMVGINLLIPARSELFATFQPLYWLLLIAVLGLTFGIFHYAEFNIQKNWHGFPYRLFTLPVPTVVLIGVPMFIGLIAVEFVYFTWAYFVFAPVGKVLPVWPGLVLGSGVLCYQAIIWALAGFRIVRMVTLAVMGLLYMNLGMLPVMLELLPWDRERTLRVFTSLIVVFSGTAFAAAWGSVERQRQGGGRGKGGMKALCDGLLDSLPRRTRPFRTPSAAQFWFEWQRGGWILPAAILLAIILIFLPVSWFTRRDPQAVLITLGWLAASPIFVGMMVGKGFAKPDFWSGELALPSFLATRPLACGELVITKMKVAALSVVITWTLVLVFLGLWLPLWANNRLLLEWLERQQAISGSGATVLILLLGFVAAAILTWRGLVASLWTGLSGNKRTFIGEGIAQVALVIVAISGAVYVHDHFDRSELARTVSAVTWFLMAMVLVKVWLAVFSWKQISPRHTAQYALLWAVATAIFVALGALLSLNVFWIKQIVLLAALLPVPLVRLALAVRSLVNNRHH